MTGKFLANVAPEPQGPGVSGYRSRRQSLFRNEATEQTDGGFRLRCPEAAWRQRSMRLTCLVAAVAAILLCPAPAANAQEFPDGPGKEVFVAACGVCHEIGRARAGYTPEGWRTVVQMMRNVAAPVPADKWDVLTEYLIKSFP